MRKHLVKSAEFWFKNAHDFRLNNVPNRGIKNWRVQSMIQAYNHVENALAYILKKSPEAKRIFEEINNK